MDQVWRVQTKRRRGKGPKECHEDARYPWERSGFKAVLQVVKDDTGWQEWGVFLLVNMESREAIITAYFEDSYYSSKTGIQMDEFNVQWRGPLDGLFEIARRRRDPKVPARAILASDCDFAVWDELFRGILAWQAQGCPLWSGRGRGPMRFDLFVPSNHRCYNGAKTPLARVVAAEWAASNAAATKIQAAFRGWRWRLTVLFNPHTELGRAYLARSYDDMSGDI